MLRIGITGISSTLAQTIVPLLLADPEVEEVVGVDIRPPSGLESSKLKFYPLDVRDSGLPEIFAGLDAVIHLAFIVVENIPDLQTIFDVNINGSQNVFEAAVAAGVPKIIHMSSVAAYGMTPEVPPVVTEETPLRGAQTTAFYYAYTKGVVEDNLNTFEQAHPQVCVTRFRPQIITGPHFLSRTTNLEIFLRPLRAKTARMLKPQNMDRPLLQLCHEEDVATAVSFAIHRNLAGAFNLAATPLDLIEYCQRRGIKLRLLPVRLAIISLNVARVFSKRARVARTWLEGARYMYVASTDKIRAQGFSFQYPTTEDCIEEALQFPNTHVTPS